MPSFANADNAFMGIFANVPNKGADVPEVEEHTNRRKVRSKRNCTLMRVKNHPALILPSINVGERKKVSQTAMTNPLQKLVTSLASVTQS